MHVKYWTLGALSLMLAASPALAGGAASGEAAFKGQCAMCHSVKDKAAPGIGPSLYKVVGRKAGSLPGFAYSPAMQKAGFVWAAPKLTAYLAAPQKVVPGNRMPFVGIADKAVAADIAAYLATLR